MKNFAVLAISIFLLIITLHIPSYNAAEIRYGKTILQQMNNSQSLVTIYNYLVDGCKGATKTISFQNLQNKITSSELECVYRIFHDDYPEYFWVQGGYQFTLENNKVISVTPKYTFTGERLKSAKSTFESKVNQFIEGLNGKSDYEKSLILHERLADAAEYTTVCNNHQNAYGALVEGKAVCAGYSKAYQYLLNKVGIPAWCIYGTSINPATNLEESHEWNLVCLDGKWYYSDVTWDDQGDYRFYTYLNMTSSQLGENHKFSNFEEYKYLPNATSTDDNYFVKNSLVYNDLDLDRLAKDLEDGNNKINLYINSSINTFQNNLYNNFPSLIKKMDVPNDYRYSYTTAVLGHEVIISVSIINPEHQHNLTMVPAKAPTCNEKGKLAYYTCDCGHWFSDPSALTEITDISTLNIPALSHTPSEWKSDSNNHWKICTTCGVEIANTLQSHTTPDQNNNCHICSASLFVEPSEPIVSTDDTTSNNNNTSSQNSSTESIISETSSLKEPIEYKNISSSISSVEEDSTLEKVEDDDNDTKIIYFVIPTSVAGGGGIIALIIFLIKSKISKF